MTFDNEMSDCKQVQFALIIILVIGADQMPTEISLSKGKYCQSN